CTAIVCKRREGGVAFGSQPTNPPGRAGEGDSAHEGEEHWSESGVKGGLGDAGDVRPAGDPAAATADAGGGVGAAAVRNAEPGSARRRDIGKGYSKPRRLTLSSGTVTVR